MLIFNLCCPECSSKNIKQHCTYTADVHVRRIYNCADCNNYFSETKNTDYKGLRTPLSRIITILNCGHYGYGNQRHLSCV